MKIVDSTENAALTRALGTVYFIHGGFGVRWLNVSDNSNSMLQVFCIALCHVNMRCALILINVHSLYKGCCTNVHILLLDNHVYIHVYMWGSKPPMKLYLSALYEISLNTHI